MTLGELALAFARVGLQGFGGVLPFARRMLVEQKRWLTPAEFTEILGFCQVLPGPNVAAISVIVGARFHGAPRALTAITALTLPPATLILLIGILYERYGHLAPIRGVLAGVSPAAAGLLVTTALKMAPPLLQAPAALAVALLAFVGVAVLRWPLVPVLLAMLPLSLAVAWSRRA